MFVVDSGWLDPPLWIVNFPTKGHWKARSRLADIAAGLDDLRSVIDRLGISSIALPPLGCGNGGLNWSDVRPLIVERLGDLPELEIVLYPPQDAPAASMMAKGQRPRMTVGKAALVGTLARYMETAISATLIEVQKLMYFLQESGEPLRLNVEKGRYGPYADNLRHSLNSMEGHFLSGYGDGSRSVLTADPITVMPGAASEAEAALADQPDTCERITGVLDLVDGFETAYGTELLASVHWVAMREGALDASEVAVAVRSWSPRKSTLFTDYHCQVAWNQLAELGWLTPRSAE